MIYFHDATHSLAFQTIFCDRNTGEKSSRNLGHKTVCPRGIAMVQIMLPPGPSPPQKCCPSFCHHAINFSPSSVSCWTMPKLADANKCQRSKFTPSFANSFFLRSSRIKTQLSSSAFTTPSFSRSYSEVPHYLIIYSIFDICSPSVQIRFSSLFP